MWLCLSCVYRESIGMSPIRKTRIVAFGDSITQGLECEALEQRWPSLVEKMLQILQPDTHVEIINSGVGGNTSREGLARFGKDVSAHKPDLVLIEFGGNDATPAIARFVPVAEYRQNLETMISDISEWGGRSIILPFPPIIDVWHTCWSADKFLDAGGTDRYVESYRDCSRRIAAEKKLKLADIDLALREAIKADGVASQIRQDGVHLTWSGNITAALCVCKTIAGII